MSQEIRVLCCFKCKMYQVDIVKKAKKWQCKMCGEKQSVFREFFRGTGAECRQKAQELNFTSNSKRHEVENEILDLLEREDLKIDPELLAKQEQQHSRGQLKTTDSKWTRFVDAPREDVFKHITEEQPNKVKRKADLKTDFPQSTKSSRLSAPSSSKWDAYL